MLNVVRPALAVVSVASLSALLYGAKLLMGLNPEGASLSDLGLTIDDLNRIKEIPGLPPEVKEVIDQQMQNSSEYKDVTSIQYKADKEAWGGDETSAVVVKDTQKAEKLVDKLEDYTVRVGTEKCGSGTGWFLDFIPPKDTESYPTIWYVGTNAHVINRFILGEANRVKNPIIWGNRDKAHCYDETKRTPLQLGRRWSKDLYEGNRRELDQDEDGERWHLKETVERKKKQNSFIKKSSAKELDKEDTTVGYVYSDISWANHFYIANSYLTEEKLKFYNYTGKYIKDFAVLELAFKSEKEAQIMTNNLYEKYYKEGAKDTPLNFLSDKYSKPHVQDVIDMPFFTLGYPYNGWTTYVPYSNYSREHKWGSAVWKSLVDYSYWKVGNIRLYDQLHETWGYRYMMHNTFQKNGASGSLVVDIDGNVMGLYSQAGENYSFIEALRGSAVQSKITNKYIAFEYDLIKGVEGQARSYRSELDATWKKTWMAQKYQWNEILRDTRFKDNKNIVITED